MFKEKFAMLKSSFVVSAISTFSTLFAFAAQLILAKSFGASIEMDAYFAAIAIPLTLIRFLSLPLQFVFVPMYKDIEQKKGQKEASNFYSLFFWGFMAFFLAISALVFVFAKPLSNAVVAGAVGSTKDLTASLLRILAFYIFFAGLYYTTQVLHIVKKSFNAPYMANALSSLTIVLYTYFFIKDQGIYAAVYGLLLGAMAELFVNLAFMPEKITTKLTIDKKLVVRFLKLFLPFSVGVMVYKSTPVIERYFASFLSNGDISVLGYANKILESVVGFLATGLSLVLLPVTSELTAKNQQKDLSNIFSWGVRTIGLLVVPVIFYLAFFSKPFISAIFERGNFTPEATSKLGGVMVFYLGSLLALSLGNQLTNIFYANKKHMTVVWINVILMPIYVGLLWFLSGRYGIAGIAVSYSAITVLTIVLFTYFIRPLISIDFKDIALAYGKFVVAAAVMAVVLVLSNGFLTSFNSSLITLGGQAALGAVSYVAVLYFLKTKEVLTVLRNIKI